MPETEKKDDDGLVLRVDMHCEACKEKVRKCVAGFPGLDSIEFNMREQKVILKGKVEVRQVFEAVKRKCGKRTVLLFPPLPKEEEKKGEEKTGEEKKGGEEEEEKETKKEEPAEESVVILKVKMHCGACVKQIKECISKIHGVSDVKVDLVGEKVEVRGKDLDPKKICDRMKRKTRKTAEHVPPASLSVNLTEEEKEEQNNMIEGEEKKPEASEEKKLEEEANKSDIDENKAKEGTKNSSTTVTEEGELKEELGELEIKKYGITPLRSVSYAYPPQVFSDENPNACSIM